MQNQRQVKRILRFALDTILFFADNTQQHYKGCERGKYVSGSCQRSREHWLKLLPDRT
jgi:hypothetical protein